MRRLSLLALVLATACAAPMPVGELAAHGDLDGDGSIEAVVLLESSSSGTGRFLHVAVVGRSDGEARNLATRFVGDRVQVRDLRIEGRQIVLDVVRAGPGDPACCPGELATLAWTLERNALQPALRPEKPTRLTPDVLAGSEWVLRKWDRANTAAAQPEVTLTFRNGRFAGFSGCNRYFAGVTTRELPGDIAVSLPGATRMACAPEVMAVESRFLQALAGVKRFGFHAGQLVLSTGAAGTSGTLVFSRR